MKSAGILLYRHINNVFEVLLVHPGDPRSTKKDSGSWSIPKGEFTNEEDPLKAAIREFKEELGIELAGEFIKIKPVKQNSKKTVYAFALDRNFDISLLKSNTFTMEWPPKSGIKQKYPEVDRAEWFDYETSREKIIPKQFKIIEELISLLVQNDYFDGSVQKKYIYKR